MKSIYCQIILRNVIFCKGFLLLNIREMKTQFYISSIMGHVVCGVHEKQLLFVR